MNKEMFKSTKEKYIFKEQGGDEGDWCDLLGKMYQLRNRGVVLCCLHPWGPKQSDLCTAVSITSTQGTLSAGNTYTHTDGSPTCQGRIYYMEDGIYQ